jgi:hypothetical protein
MVSATNILQYYLASVLKSAQPDTAIAKNAAPIAAKPAGKKKINVKCSCISTAMWHYSSSSSQMTLVVVADVSQLFIIVASNTTQNHQNKQQDK